MASRDAARIEAQRSVRRSPAIFGVTIGPYALAHPYFSRSSRAHPAGCCRRCGYELRDIASDCCHECGAAREFTIAKPSQDAARVVLRAAPSGP